MRTTTLGLRHACMPECPISLSVAEKNDNLTTNEFSCRNTMGKAEWQADHLSHLDGTNYKVRWDKLERFVPWLCLPPGTDASGHRGARRRRHENGLPVKIES